MLMSIQYMDAALASRVRQGVHLQSFLSHYTRPVDSLIVGSSSLLAIPMCRDGGKQSTNICAASP